MDSLPFNAQDACYIENSFDSIVNGYLQCLSDGRMTSSEYDHALWSTPRTLLNYYFQLTPSDELQPYYSLLDKLNSRSIELVDKHCPDRSDRCDSLQQITKRSEQFTFRPWASQDLPDYHRFLNNPKLWEQLIDDFAGEISKEQAEMLLTNSNALPTRHDVSAVEWNGQLIGQVRLEFSEDASSNSAEISYWLGEDYWGKGLMSGIIPLYTQRCFQKYPFDSLFAMVLKINKSSMRVLEKAGYRLDAANYRTVMKNGESVRLVMYRAYRRDFVDSNSHPTMQDSKGNSSQFAELR